MLEEDGFLCGLYFEDQGLSYESYTYQKDLAVFEKSEKWLKDYFDGRIPEEVPPLRLKGTQFQKDVWQALMKPLPSGVSLTASMTPTVPHIRMRLSSSCVSPLRT